MEWVREVEATAELCLEGVAGVVGEARWNNGGYESELSSMCSVTFDRGVVPRETNEDSSGFCNNRRFADLGKERSSCSRAVSPESSGIKKFARDVLLERD